MNKRIITIILALAAVCGGAKAKDRVIDRPAFRSTSTNSMFPVKVELIKTATIVHFHLNCACWRDWSMDGARLEFGGQRYAYKKGRIITHEEATVLSDETFEIGKKYAKNAQQDSLILYFDPLPNGAKTFDYVEADNDGAWKIHGIRLDNQLYPLALPPYQKPTDDGEPLQPLTLKHGEATATCTLHGGGSLSYFGPPSCDPITGLYESWTHYADSVTIYRHPAYVATRTVWLGCRVDAGMSVDQFPLLLIPGETLTLEADATACLARDGNFAAGRPANHDCYRLGGTLGDLNQVLLENEFLHYRDIKGLPTYDGGDKAEWCDALWQSLDTLRRGVVGRRGYTRRQQDFLRLLLEDYYVRTVQAHTLTDPHARDLILFRDGRSYYLPPKVERLPYLEANGLNHGEVYEMLKGFAEAKEIAAQMRQGHVQTDSVIQKAHPYFQAVLRAFNDTTRTAIERLQREAKERMMPTPDVSGDQLLQTIASQYPGKAVFFDLWATWCGPCKKGIAAMEPLKEQLKGKDVVFVYLTDESSPINEWNDYVINILGQHYRIPSALWNQIPGLTIIPQYYLFNRQGHEVWKQTGFSEEVLKEIENKFTEILGE